jgi:hypothetical protein
MRDGATKRGSRNGNSAPAYALFRILGHPPPLRGGEMARGRQVSTI